MNSEDLKTHLSPKDDEEDSASDVESVQEVEGAAFNPNERISRTMASFPCPWELTWGVYSSTTMTRTRGWVRTSLKITKKLFLLS